MSGKNGKTSVTVLHTVSASKVAKVLAAVDGSAQDKADKLSEAESNARLN